jgi:glycosyltransferase involved in cell wall biosynthesis
LAIAASRKARLDLRIAGPISDRAYFERDIAPALDQHARYAGHLSHSELANLIGGASALLFSPLWDEPYGLVLAEALACGTPIASFARGAVAEILDASCGIMVPPGDVGALAQAARDVQHLRRSDCRRRAEDIADFGVMISQYEGMYHRLIQSAKPTQVKRKAVPWNFPEIPNARGLLDYYMAHRPAMLSEVPIGLRP